jgi:hypothetical protein
MKGLLIFLLIFVVYIILFKSDCSLCSENMENTMPTVNSAFSSINEVFPEPPKRNENARIDLEKLPECNMPMKIEFTSNINNMMNNGNQIYQDIVKPDSQKSLIGDGRYNLRQISWTKSKLNWHGEELPLEIRLTNMNSEDNKITHIIFPVKFVDEKISEGFNNTFFGLDGGREIENFNSETIDNVGKFLIDVKDDITYYSKKLFSSIFGDASFAKDIININKDILNVTQDILKSNQIAQKILNQDELKQLILKTSELAKTSGVNVDIKKLVESQIGQKIKDEAKKIVTEIATVNPNIIKKLELDKPEIATKVIEIKDKLPDINLQKLDIANVVNKVETQDLDKLREKLNKIRFNDVTKDFNNQQFTTYDINSLMNLNALIKDKNVVPPYKCCTPNYGKVVSIDLCQTAQKVLDQERFFFANGNDNSLVLITKPQPYNRMIGNQIVKNLGEPKDLF